jgi:hypothetical protein
LGWLLKPRWILLGLYLGLIVVSTLAMNLTGYAGIAMAILEYVFMSGVFSIIFAIGLRGCGAHTKTAASLITAAISGGAVVPVIQNPVMNARGVRYSFCVATAVFAFGAIFPIYLNLFPQARNQVDPVIGGHHWTSPLKRQSTAVRGIGGGEKVMKRSVKGKSDLPTIEHLEGDSAAGPSTAPVAKKGQAHDLAPWESEKEDDLPDLAPWPT